MIPHRAASHRRPIRQNGFSIIEVLLGFFVLSITFVSLGAYTSSQRNGLHRSNQLSDGTQAAVSALEETKRQFSDSATFRKMWDQAGSGSFTIPANRTLNAVPYTVTVTVRRGPAPDYLLRLRARAVWKGSHSVEFGVLVPGASTGL